MKLSAAQQFWITLGAFVTLGIAFKVMVLVEGLTEVRPVNAIPPVAGLICGPIGGAACAVGNLLADLAGTFSAESLLGVTGNFIAAYLPYRLWHLFTEETPNLHSVGNMLRYCLICAVAAATVAWLLTFGLYALQGVWMEEILRYVFFNNLGFSIGLGMPLFIILTSESVAVECCRPPARSRLLKNVRARNAVCAAYAGTLLLLLAAALLLHLSPEQSPWMKPLSLAALAGLICQLV